MHIVITGGGTGGHIFPALEIAKELLHQNPQVKLSFFGNAGALEERLANNRGLYFVGLNTKPLVGQGFFAKLRSLIYLKVAVLKCMLLFIKERPNAVIGVGGYVSAPVILASFVLGIRRYLCEQNVVPGFANKMLGCLAHKIFISFAESAAYFPQGKTILTGNPIRQQFFALERQAPKAPFNILISGGSLGANFLNEELPKALSLIKESCPGLKITHQTGQAKLSLAKKYYEQAHVLAEVLPFIDDMPNAFKNTDLLISRAGATVIAEIMAAGVPAILVPYRYANAHQKANALALAKHKGALMIEEGENFAIELANTIKELYHHPRELMIMSENAKALAKPEASVRIARTVLQLN